MNKIFAVFLAAPACAWWIAVSPVLAGDGSAIPQRSLVIPVSFQSPASAPAADSANVECVVSCGAALPLSALAFSPDGKTLAVGGYREVLLWDLAEGKLAQRIGAGQIGTMVQAVAYTKDGQRLAVAEGVPYKSGAVRVFELSSGQQVMAFQEPKGTVLSLALSPDGKLLAGGSQDADAYVWNLEEKKLVTTLKDHNLAVLCVAFSADGKYLAAGSADRTVQVWEVGPWEPDRKKTKLEGEVRRCLIRSYSENKERKITQFNFALLMGGRDDRTLQFRPDDKTPFWARNDVKAEMDAGIPLDCTWPFKDSKTGKDSKTYYVACSDHTIKVISENRGKLSQTATLHGHDDWVYAVALSPDGKLLASAGGEGTVRLWNTADNSPLATLVQAAPGTDDWVIVTAQGYLAGPKAKEVKWNGPKQKLTPEKTAGLISPEMVRQVLAGRGAPSPSL